MIFPGTARRGHFRDASVAACLKIRRTPRNHSDVKEFLQ
jgi:hypothetical protein